MTQTNKTIEEEFIELFDNWTSNNFTHLTDSSILWAQVGRALIAAGWTSEGEA